MPPTRSSAPSDTGASRRARRIFLAAVVAVVAVVAAVTGLVVATSGGSSTDSRAPQVSDANVARPGDPAPDLELTALDGGRTVRLAAFRGRPVLVNFWASWCDPCRKEFPLFVAALKEHHGAKLALLGVDYKDIDDDARAFGKKMHATWPLLRDQGGATARAYGVRAVPQTFFIRADGTIAQRVFGLPSSDVLERELARILPPSPR